jgi:hypothetical protein
MPTSQRRTDAGVIGQLHATPQRFEFFQAAWLVEQWRPDSVRFRNRLAMSFPPNQIENVSIDDNSVRITPAFIGLLGSQGVLPLHYSERISSDHASTQLNLGFLTDSEKGDTAAMRGEGGELITSESIAIRARNGILLSAKLDDDGAQLARTELLGTAELLNSIADQLTSLAKTHTSDDDAEPQLGELVNRVKEWAARKNLGVIAASAPDGLLLGSEKNILVYVGQIRLQIMRQSHRI